MPRVEGTYRRGIVRRQYSSICTKPRHSPPFPSLPLAPSPPRLLLPFPPCSVCQRGANLLTRHTHSTRTDPVVVHYWQRSGVHRPARGLAHGGVVQPPPHRPDLELLRCWLWLRGSQEHHLLRASHQQHRRLTRKCVCAAVWALGPLASPFGVWQKGVGAFGGSGGVRWLQKGRKGGERGSTHDSACIRMYVWDWDFSL